MNINTYNYGHYRLTDYGRNDQYQLFNRENDYVTNITKGEFQAIRQAEDKLSACKAVETAHMRTKEFVA
jgi:hypothetical protein